MSLFDEAIKDALEGGDDSGVFHVGNGCCRYVIVVVIIHNKNIGLRPLNRLEVPPWHLCTACHAV